MAEEQLAWLISTDMGYGHQRAIYPLRQWGGGEIIDAANNQRITKEEKLVWNRMLNIYEFFSRAGKLPLIGKQLSRLLDRALYIPQFYPLRDLSHPTFQVKLLRKNIEKGLCRGALSMTSSRMLPIVTSFYAPAMAADIKGEQKVYCIICDTDLNRVWVGEDPWESRVIYLVPTGRAAQRLRSYGVGPERIHTTGFPLPLELTGGEDLSVLKKNLSVRLKVLDPKNRFHALHHKSVEHFLGKQETQLPPTRKLTLMFAVGGAGAQKEIAKKIISSLSLRLMDNEINLILVAGTRPEVFDYFQRLKLKYTPNSSAVEIIFGSTNSEYFDKFNTALARTDVLWTKPSELSFYCGLGLPIILTPIIGPQEWFNRKWLREIGAGFKQYNPDYTDEWLIDLLNKGRLAEMAWSGFLKARKCGSFKIKELLTTGAISPNSDPLKR